MTQDQFLNQYIDRIKKEIEAQTTALTRQAFGSMYEVGRSQGILQGLDMALENLQAVLEDDE